MTDQRILTKLATLQKTLSSAGGQDSGSFSAAFHAFLDITEDRALMVASKPAKDAALKVALESPIRTLFDDESIELQQLRMLRVAAAGFLHGGFFVGSSVGSFFYFEKPQQGLMALHGRGSMTHFMRITMTELPRGTVMMRKPEGKQ
jgi:hypothetical protein